MPNDTALPGGLPPAGDGRLAKLTAARRTIEWQGKPYTLAPLTLRQHAELKRLVQDYARREYARVRDLMQAVDAPQADLDALRDEAIAALRDPFRSRLMRDAEPVLHWTRLMLAAHHPDLTLDQVEQLIADTADALDAVSDLSAPEEAVKNSSGASTPPAAAATTTAKTPRRSGSKPSKPSRPTTAGRRRKSRR